MQNFELLHRPWAILPEAVPALFQASAARPTPEAIQADFRGNSANKVAIVPVKGVLYGYKYQGISNAVESAAADPNVKHIVLAVDSPGGEVLGCQETAAVIAAAARAKPVTAVVEGTCASAAYWIASQASKITVTPSGEVGSVGVRMLHGDISKSLENSGVKVTELQAGEHKSDWSPYKPLSEDAAANMQTRLDATHADFLQAVATGRGNRASADIAGQRFGEGRMFSAADAAKHGLVDNVQSARDFYRAIAPAEESAPTSFPIRARLDLERNRF